MIVLNPEKKRCSRGISPLRMSQMPNNSIPQSLVIFTERLL